MELGDEDIDVVREQQESPPTQPWHSSATLYEEPDTDAPLPGSLSIDEWYSKVIPRYVDLIGDFGGKELFIVEGDSLLHHLFPSLHLTSTLHLFHILETFLLSLHNRNARYELVS
ncbi:hypothetical protein BC829DRAFT_445488 [Chytridium lagenaria]|nr:hypothetical protein BC829DRAFT_445488 [Chytridium lagenaria]